MTSQFQRRTESSEIGTEKGWRNITFHRTGEDDLVDQWEAQSIVWPETCTMMTSVHAWLKLKQSFWVSAIQHFSADHYIVTFARNPTFMLSCMSLCCSMQISHKSFCCKWFTSGLRVTGMWFWLWAHATSYWDPNGSMCAAREGCNGR
jgi:hypothetical protein